MYIYIYIYIHNNNNTSKGGTDKYFEDGMFECEASICTWHVKVSDLLCRITVASWRRGAVAGHFYRVSAGPNLLPTRCL